MTDGSVQFWAVAKLSWTIGTARNQTEQSVKRWLDSEMLLNIIQKDLKEQTNKTKQKQNYTKIVK